jgi:TatD DNase family protein
VLIDTHAHLDFPEFEGQDDTVLQRAREAGVTRVITVGTDRESCRRALALAEKHADVFAVIGLHPCSAADDGAADFLAELPALARHEKVVAIGETGLDYHRLPGRELAATKEESAISAMQAVTFEATEALIADGAIKSAQAAAFKAQLDLAVETGLNVVVHQRDSWQDTLEFLRPYTGKLRAVFHCFGGSPEDAAELRGMGHLVSFTGIVTFKKAALVCETAAAVPSDGYMVETDCPYLAPVPFRGQTCEPAHVRLVAQKIAELRGATLDTVAAETSATARGFFRFRD